MPNENAPAFARLERFELIFKKENQAASAEKTYTREIPTQSAWSFLNVLFDCVA